MGKKKISKAEQLNHKHRLFADEYLMNGNRLDKAIMKVYTHIEDPIYASKFGYQVKQRPEVKRYIEEAQAILETNYKIKREDITRNVFQLMEECSRDGDRSNYIKLLDMLNKMSGNYVTKQEISVDGKGIVFNFHAPEDGNSEE